MTALPYGINTVSLFAFVFLVMLPAKLTAQAEGSSPEQAARLAWRGGLLCADRRMGQEDRTNRAAR